MRKLYIVLCLIFAYSPARAVVQSTLMGDANLTLSTTTQNIVTTRPLTAPRTIFLPSAAGTLLGQSGASTYYQNCLVFFDQAGGVSSSNTVQFLAVSPDTINGASSLTISNPNLRVTMCPVNGGGWYASVEPQSSILPPLPLSVTNGGTGVSLVANGNNIFSSPDGVAGPPTFRSLVNTDLPKIANNTILGNTSGITASPTALTTASWFDNAFCNTIGFVIARTTGAWSCTKGIPASVQWFGAKCDGTTDDTAAINTAFASGADWVVFDGTCVVSTLNAPPTGMRITGTSRQNAFIKTNSATGNVLTLSNGNVTIEHIGFSSSISRTGGCYVVLQGSNQIINDYQMISAFCAITIDSASSTIVISNGFISNPVAGSNSVIQVGTGVGSCPCALRIFNNNITSTAFPGPTAGINILNAGDAVLHDNLILYAQHSILIDPGLNQFVRSVVITGCCLDQGQVGLLDLLPTSNGLIQQLTVSGAYIAGGYNGSSQIINLSGSGSSVIDGINISNSIIVGAGNIAQPSNCILLNGNIKNVIIQGNMITDCANGINISPTTNLFTNFNIANNRIGPFGQFTGAITNQSIILQSPTNLANITHNNLTGNSGGSILNLSANILNRIEGNFGYNPIGTSGVTITSSPMTITAGPTPTTYYLVGGWTISSLVIGGNAIDITTRTIDLGPNESFTATYSAAGTIIKSVH